eukprot:2948294-Pleurochrysis_carterae.AAC.1
MNFLLAKVIGTHCAANATTFDAATATFSSKPPIRTTPPPASTGTPASARSTVTRWETPASPDVPSTSAISAPPASEAPQQPLTPPHFQRTLGSYPLGRASLQPSSSHAHEPTSPCGDEVPAARSPSTT